MPNKQYPKNPKVCERCGNEYMPRSGAQRKCDSCRAMKPKAVKRRRPIGKQNDVEPLDPPPRSRQEEARRKRGRELRNSEIAMEAEDRLHARIGPMVNIKDGE